MGVDSRHHTVRGWMGNRHTGNNGKRIPKVMLYIIAFVGCLEDAQEITECQFKSGAYWFETEALCQEVVQIQTIPEGVVGQYFCLPVVNPIEYFNIPQGEDS